jgi:hypothetical protein
MSTSWDRARTIADAVLYEGYLLYPYRSNSAKNQSRWQFGVVGPAGAAEAGIGEDDTLAAQFLVDSAGALSLVVRFLHLQRRQVERDLGDGRFEPVNELTVGAKSWLTWDEAVESELSFGPFNVADLMQPRTIPLDVAAGTDIEEIDGGRLVRTRQNVRAQLTVGAEPDGTLHRIAIAVYNTGTAATDKDDAIARSLIGAHVVVEAIVCEFVSLLEPPESAAEAVARCQQHRCFPVLAGRPGEYDLLLVSPIILYDHPEIAEQSEGALYDSTEIDEILTLRVMTMTDEEKAQARATDPLAAQLIDRCDSMSPEAMQRLHGVLRDPHAGSPGGLTPQWSGSGLDIGDLIPEWSDSGADTSGLIPEVPEGVDWWDPLADTAVQPGVDAVLVNGIRVSAGSRVRLRPSRRADAQDIFFAGKTARVASVHEDVDGNQHVGVIVEDEPEAEMPEGYRRYLYFAPDEVEPIATEDANQKFTERRS